MATLNIREFPDELCDRLRVQAAQHGRSMEAEARRLLTQCLTEGVRRDDGRSAAMLRDVQAWVAANLVKPQAGSKAMAELLRDRRREAIAEAIGNGHEPAVYFGAEYDRIRREAGWSKADVRPLTENRR